MMDDKDSPAPETHLTQMLLKENKALRVISKELMKAVESAGEIHLWGRFTPGSITVRREVLDKWKVLYFTDDPSTSVGFVILGKFEKFDDALKRAFNYKNMEDGITEYIPKSDTNDAW